MFVCIMIKLIRLLFKITYFIPFYYLEIVYEYIPVPKNASLPRNKETRIYTCPLPYLKCHIEIKLVQIFLKNIRFYFDYCTVYRGTRNRILFLIVNIVDINISKL